MHEEQIIQIEVVEDGKFMLGLTSLGAVYRRETIPNTEWQLISQGLDDKRVVEEEPPVEMVERPKGNKRSKKHFVKEPEV